jgi:hypothetical protein
MIKYMNKKITIIISALLLIGVGLVLFGLKQYYYGNLLSKFEMSFNNIYNGKGWQFSKPVDIIPCDYFKPNNLTAKVLVQDKASSNYSIYNVQFVPNQSITSNDFKLDRLTYGLGSSTLIGNENDIKKLYESKPCSDLQKSQTIDGVQITYNPPLTPDQIQQNEAQQAQSIQSNKQAQILKSGTNEQKTELCLKEKQGYQDVVDAFDAGKQVLKGKQLTQKVYEDNKSYVILLGKCEYDANGNIVPGK